MSSKRNLEVSNPLGSDENEFAVLSAARKTTKMEFSFPLSLCRAGVRLLGCVGEAVYSKHLKT
jgi:hypothetical protein